MWPRIRPVPTCFVRITAFVQRAPSRRIRGLDGRWMRGEFFVQRWTDLELLSISPALWNDYPVARISDPAGRSPERLVNRWFICAAGWCLKGMRPVDSVWRMEPAVLLLNATGPMFLKTVLWICSAGWRCAGGVPVLRYLYRGEGRTGRGDNLPVLNFDRTDLPTQSGRGGAAVSGPGARSDYQSMESDGAVSAGFFARNLCRAGGPVNLQIGDYCEIEGETGPYQFPSLLMPRMSKCSAPARCRNRCSRPGTS